MSLYDKITLLIDSEVNERVTRVLNEYTEIVANKHGISKELLLRDIPDTFASSICKGVKNDGHRCTFRGVHDGYCRHHKHLTHTPIIRPSPLRSSLHIHGPEISRMEGCPGCESSNGLIDLNSF